MLRERRPRYSGPNPSSSNELGGAETELGRTVSLEPVCVGTTWSSTVGSAASSATSSTTSTSENVPTVVSEPSIRARIRSSWCWCERWIASAAFGQGSSDRLARSISHNGQDGRSACRLDGVFRALRDDGLAIRGTGHGRDPNGATIAVSALSSVVSGPPNASLGSCASGSTGFVARASSRGRTGTTPYTDSIS